MIAVFGATGNTGRATVKELLALGESPLCIVRNSDKAQEVLGEDVRTALADITDRPAMEQALKGVKSVFVVTGHNPEADKQQILTLISGMQAAWNRGDFRAYMDGFKNPGVVFVSGGRFQDGWQGTLDHYIRDYSASRGTLRFYDIQVEILSADAAQLISRFELVRPQHPQYGINTRLMRKVSGRWVIALNHVSASETPPPTP
jgi:NAD(P)-dependent dehydrogenase (short-subunit alcohol dehydrogenase family)